MYYKFNLILLLALMVSSLFALNPQTKNELPISSYINPQKYITADSLLKFENVGYEIQDSIEKSKYYFIVAHLLNNKIVELNVKMDNNIEKISDLINSYEEKLIKDHYIVNYELPFFDYEYKYIKFSDKAVINKVFYKQAIALKEQYIQTYKTKIKLSI